jgi:hypothetical protein
VKRQIFKCRCTASGRYATLAVVAEKDPDAIRMAVAVFRGLFPGLPSHVRVERVGKPVDIEQLTLVRAEIYEGGQDAAE